MPLAGSWLLWADQMVALVDKQRLDLTNMAVLNDSLGVEHATDPTSP